MRPSAKRLRRHSTADARGRRKDLYGIGLSLLVLMAVVGTGAAVVAFKPPPRDETTGCRLNAPPTSLVVVLVDASDPLTPRQDGDVRRRLDEIRATVPTDGRIELYALTDKPDALLTPAVVACNPGSGAMINPLFGSPKIAEDRWRRLFVEPFDRALQESLRTAPSKLSPIIEAVQSVAVTALSRAEYRNIERRLVVASDFIQNVPDLNQYSGVMSFEKFASTAYYRKVRSDLRGVDVELLYLWRKTSKNVQGRAHAEFWSALFLDEGARPTVKSIQG